VVSTALVTAATRVRYAGCCIAASDRVVDLKVFNNRSILPAIVLRFVY